jgi:hypothetical protein
VSKKQTMIFVIKTEEKSLKRKEKALKCNDDFLSYRLFFFSTDTCISTHTLYNDHIEAMVFFLNVISLINKTIL